MFLLWVTRAMVRVGHCANATRTPQLRMLRLPKTRFLELTSLAWGVVSFSVALALRISSIQHLPITKRVGLGVASQPKTGCRSTYATVFFIKIRQIMVATVGIFSNSPIGNLQIWVVISSGHRGMTRLL